MVGKYLAVALLYFQYRNLSNPWDEIESLSSLLQLLITQCPIFFSNFVSNSTIDILG